MFSLNRIRASAVIGSLLALGILIARPIAARAVDLDELTVVTLARDGSWGVATAGSTGEAIAAAVRACRAMAVAPTDCGAQFTTTRGKWVIANLCGDHQIIVGARVRADAEAAAIERELQTRQVYVPDLPRCRRVLTVDPNGVVLPSQAASAEETEERRAAGPILAKAQPAASGPAERFDANALTAESDFTVFMREEVPEDVRRIALRKLWTLMQLPNSCMELCIEPGPSSAARRVASTRK
jgi:uncharacterized protein DUF3306